MTLAKEISLPASAEVRPSQGADDGWVQVCPDLWISSVPSIAEAVPASERSEPAQLSYNFASAELEPIQVAQAYPEIATRVLARSRVVLDTKLSSLDVCAKPIPVHGSQGFPALNWPSLGRLTTMAAMRERHRNRSAALRRFLVANQAFENGSGADFVKAIVDFSRALPIPVAATLKIIADEEQGVVDVRLQMEDPGLAIPGAGRFVLSGFGYKFERSADRSPEDLRLAYAEKLADDLAVVAQRFFWVGAFGGLVTVTVGEATTRLEFVGNQHTQ